jgi:hypothetical protein
MATAVKEKVITLIDVEQRTRIFLVGVAVLAVVAVIAFLVSAPAPSIASSGSAQRPLEADSALYENDAYYAAQAQAKQRPLEADSALYENDAYYAAQAQAEPQTKSAYEAINTARELRNTNRTAPFTVSE